MSLTSDNCMTVVHCLKDQNIYAKEREKGTRSQVMDVLSYPLCKRNERETTPAVSSGVCELVCWIGVT